LPDAVRPMRLRLVLGLALANGGCSVASVKKADPEASAASNVILYPALPSASILRGGLLLELRALRGRMALARRLMHREPKIRDLRTCAILGN
jgi:hypothetical protein